MIVVIGSPVGRNTAQGIAAAGVAATVGRIAAPPAPTCSWSARWGRVRSATQCSSRWPSRGSVTWPCCVTRRRRRLSCRTAPRPRRSSTRSTAICGVRRFADGHRPRRPMARRSTRATSSWPFATCPTTASSSIADALDDGRALDRRRGRPLGGRPADRRGRSRVDRPGRPRRTPRCSRRRRSMPRARSRRWSARYAAALDRGASPAEAFASARRAGWAAVAD